MSPCWQCLRTSRVCLTSGCTNAPSCLRVRHCHSPYPQRDGYVHSQGDQRNVQVLFYLLIDISFMVYIKYNMWRIEEHRRIDKQIASVPKDIVKRYEKWKDIASISGPPGLRLVKGFHDEALSGRWKGYRSSRLGIQWRVVYSTIPEDLLFQVASITAYDYRRP